MRCAGRAAMLTIVAVVTVMSATAAGYSHIGVQVGSEVKALKWNTMRPQWFVRERGVPGVSAAQFQQELERAFAAWEAIPTAAIAFQFGGFTAAAPFDDDGLSVLGFQAEADMDRVLAATTFVVDVVTGELVESDIFFNSIFPWSVAPSGEAGRFDLRSVATHEIGHFIGLGHSAIGETELRPDGTRRVIAAGAVMFPISLGRGVIADRVLEPDDVAGASDLYPAGDFEDDTGIIAGTVRMSGSNVFGAHVVLFNPRTGALIGGLSDSDGHFRIGGLSPGPHVVRVEPLDDVDVESFFEHAVVDTGFRVGFHPRLVAAPAGAAERVDVVVQPK